MSGAPFFYNRVHWCRKCSTSITVSPSLLSFIVLYLLKFGKMSLMCLRFNWIGRQENVVALTSNTSQWRCGRLNKLRCKFSVMTTERCHTSCKQKSTTNININRKCTQAQMFPSTIYLFYNFLPLLYYHFGNFPFEWWHT